MVSKGRFILAGMIFILLSTGLSFSASAFQAAIDDNETNLEAGLEAWDKIYQITSHPRCANCHVADGVPVWSGPSYGKERPHGMFVGGDPDNLLGEPGQYCTTCHMSENSKIAHGPPGAPVWHLPPAEMVWHKKSSAEICAQLKDPIRNGGRTLAEIETHVAEDTLVAWGWEPGPGRESAPYSANEMAGFVRQWAASGTPCPTSVEIKAAQVTDGSPQEPEGTLTPIIVGDIESGRKAASVCKSCHSFEQGGKNRSGPNLWNIAGKDIASVPGFKYSKALASLDGNWDDEKLDKFLKKPRKFVPGTSMAIGIKKDKRRADIIAYLKSLK